MMSSFLATFFQILLQVLWLAILGRVLLSWVDRGGQMRISQFLFEITEPIIGPVRRIMPNTGMIDFSPMVALILLSLLRNILLGALQGR
jgi:YggT family protein